MSSDNRFFNLPYEIQINIYKLSLNSILTNRYRIKKYQQEILKSLIIDIYCKQNIYRYSDNSNNINICYGRYTNYSTIIYDSRNYIDTCGMKKILDVVEPHIENIIRFMCKVITNPIIYNNKYPETNLYPYNNYKWNIIDFIIHCYFSLRIYRNWFILDKNNIYKLINDYKHLNLDKNIIKKRLSNIINYIIKLILIFKKKLRTKTIGPNHSIYYKYYIEDLKDFLLYIENYL